MTWKLVLVALAATAPLAAQQPMTMEGSMMEHMGPAMMKLMLYTPHHLLARKDTLGLTPDQVNRLTALRDGAMTTHDAAMRDAQTQLQAMEQAATAAQPDSVTLKTHFQAAHAAMGKAHWAMLASATQARAVLTDAQRAKVQQWADSMQAWAQQHRQMMPPQRPH